MNSGRAVPEIARIMGRLDTEQRVWGRPMSDDRTAPQVRNCPHCGREYRPNKYNPYSITCGSRDCRRAQAREKERERTKVGRKERGKHAY